MITSQEKMAIQSQSDFFYILILSIDKNCFKTKNIEILMMVSYRDVYTTIVIYLIVPKLTKKLKQIGY